MIIGLYVSCSEPPKVSTDNKPEHSDIIQVLSDLIENFTYVMDLNVDGELFNTTTSTFESTLNLATSEKLLPMLSRLLHLTVLGAYRVQCHTIKDNLSKSGVMTLQGSQIYSTAPWNTRLLQNVLEYVNLDNSSSVTRSSLELAIKLQNLKAAMLIVQRGGTFCESFSPPKCSNAVHYAIINDNLRDLKFVINSIKFEYLRYTSNNETFSSLLQSLLTDTFMYDSTFLYSPLHISNLHCVTGLSCESYSYLTCTSYLSHDQQEMTLPPRILHTQTCSASDMDVSSDHRKWYVDSKQTSGWKSYGGFGVGKSSRCDLPRLNVHDSDFFRELERLFVDLGYVDSLASVMLFHLMCFVSSVVFLLLVKE